MNMKIGIAVVATAAALCSLLLAPPRALQADDTFGDGSWRTLPVWDDGKAEVAVYEVSWRRYGRLYEGRAMTVAVKEPWAPDLDVKADTPRPDGFDVLKLNHIRDVRTGVYSYHQMASAFLRRDDGSLRKLSAMSSEACGLSTADLAGGTLTTRSYFDGQGTRTQEFPGGALPEDSLPLTLREFVTGPVPERVEIFPTLMEGRFPRLEAKNARLQRSAPRTVDVPAGTFEAVDLSLQRGATTLTYTFATAAPHPLVAFTHSDGTTYRLAKVERIPYWSMSSPRHEAWLPEHLRSE